VRLFVDGVAILVAAWLVPGLARRHRHGRDASAAARGR
jgi:hypothetical protein